MAGSRGDPEALAWLDRARQMQVSVTSFCTLVETGRIQQCTKCGEVLPWNQFYRDRKRRGGRRSECKVCTRVAKGITENSP